MLNPESLSVVVPLFNGAKFVERCFRTVAQQTVRPEQLIFVDDGSTDDSLERVRRLPSAGFEVRVLTQPNAGPSRARNVGLAEASGSLLAFLDVDDEWAPDCIAQWTAAFQGEVELAVVGGLVQLDWGVLEPARNARLQLPHRRVNLGAYAFRRQVFRLIGGFDESLRYAEDVDFFARIIAAGLSCKYLDRTLLHYRQHARGMTHGRGVRELGIFEALSKALGRARSPGDPSDESEA